jgi:hypothetical protein
MLDQAGLEKALRKAQSISPKLELDDVRAIVFAYLQSDLAEAVQMHTGRNSPRLDDGTGTHDLTWEGERIAASEMRVPGVRAVCKPCGYGRTLQGARYGSSGLVRLDIMHMGFPDPFPRGS